MRPQADIFELIWRIWKNTLVHEYVFSFRTDEEIRPYNIYSKWTSHYLKPIDNNYFFHGIPLPEPGGKIVDHYRGEKMCRVYMDFAALCPECGRLNDIDDLSYPEWRRHREIDKNLMWRDIDSKLGNPEFVYKTCIRLESCNWEVQWLTNKANERYFKKEEPPTVDIPQSVYAISADPYIKIGIARNVTARLSILQTSSPFPLTILKTWTPSNPKSAERQLHEKFSEYRCSGEWFKLPPEALKQILELESLDDL